MKYFAPTRISDNIAETPEGFLICIGVPITRTGTLEYGPGETPIETNEDGIAVISRSEQDIFNAITISSFQGKPITINHPEKFVDPNSWGLLAKGNMQNVRRGEGDKSEFLLADLLITDAMAIGLVKRGLREVSCGYEAEYTETGEGEGRQSRIIGNHLALVDKGRAGSLCAINDHERKETTTMSKLQELLKKLTKVADEEMKEEKKDDKAKDEKEEPKKDDKKDDSKDAGAYDELVQCMNAMNEKMESFMKNKKDDKADDASEEPKKDDMPEEKKADDEEVAPSLEDRLKSLETAVAKLLEGKSSDADMEEDDESEDDDFEESSMVGDTASRAEILSPGIKVTKDVKALALKAAYGTKEGKEVIDSLTNGKPTFDSADRVATLFIAASEVLKATRTKELSKTKQAKDSNYGESGAASPQPMTAERLNEINAAHWARK